MHEIHHSRRGRSTFELQLRYPSLAFALDPPTKVDLLAPESRHLLPGRDAKVQGVEEGCARSPDLDLLFGLPPRPSWRRTHDVNLHTNAGLRVRYPRRPFVTIPFA